MCLIPYIKKTKGEANKMKQKSFALTWWGKTWIEALERLGSIWENRLPRGRGYARRGKVVKCEIQPGSITARVSGTRETPYKVKIKVRDGIVHELGKEAMFQCVQASIVFNGGEVKEVLLNGKTVLSAEEVEMKCSCIIENY